MPISFVCEPRKTVERDRFFREFPPYSIAIDGYCKGAPGWSRDGLRLNINHHEDVDRVATRSSCAQAYALVKLGLYDTFSINGHKVAKGYINDCDQDVQLATYVLKHPTDVDTRPRLKHMVQLEDVMDMAAGLYPVKRRWHLLKKLLWVSEPYTDARANGAIGSMDADGMMAIIDESHRRIRATLFGRGEEIEPDTRFDVLREFPQWSFIREVGAHARLGIAQKKIKAFVSLVSCDGPRCRVVIMRRSRAIRWFPLPRIRSRLNREEGIAARSTDSWGGNCDNVIASPRAKGTAIPQERILEIVQEECERERHRMRREAGL